MPCSFVFIKERKTPESHKSWICFWLKVLLWLWPRSIVGPGLSIMIDDSSSQCGWKKWNDRPRREKGYYPLHGVPVTTAFLGNHLTLGKTCKALHKRQSCDPRSMSQFLAYNKSVLALWGKKDSEMDYSWEHGPSGQLAKFVVRKENGSVPLCQRWLQRRPFVFNQWESVV